MLILVASKDTGEDIFDVFMFQKKKIWERDSFVFLFLMQFCSLYTCTDDLKSEYIRVDCCSFLS